MPRSLYTLYVDTENAASLAERWQAALSGANGGYLEPCAVCADVAGQTTPQQIEDARRNLTLAALRWQAALDADTTEVS